MVRYSTALSHFFLACIGIFCLKNILKDFRGTCNDAPFILVSVTSLLGLWRWGNPLYGEKVAVLYLACNKVQELLVLPTVVTALYIKYHYHKHVAWMHIASCMVPVLYFLYNRRRNFVIDIVLVANLLSLLIVSVENSNFFGVSTVLSFLLSHFLIKRNVLAACFPLEVPTLDLFNYSLCFFTYFSYKAIMDPIYY